MVNYKTPLHLGLGEQNYTVCYKILPVMSSWQVHVPRSGLVLQNGVVWSFTTCGMKAYVGSGYITILAQSIIMQATLETTV